MNVPDPARPTLRPPQTSIGRITNNTRQVAARRCGRPVWSVGLVWNDVDERTVRVARYSYCTRTPKIALMSLSKRYWKHKPYHVRTGPVPYGITVQTTLFTWPARISCLEAKDQSSQAAREGIGAGAACSSAKSLV